MDLETQTAWPQACGSARFNIQGAAKPQAQEVAEKRHLGVFIPVGRAPGLALCVKHSCMCDQTTYRPNLIVFLAHGIRRFVLFLQKKSQPDPPFSLLLAGDMVTHFFYRDPRKPLSGPETDRRHRTCARFGVWCLI